MQEPRDESIRSRRARGRRLAGFLSLIALAAAPLAPAGASEGVDLASLEGWDLVVSPKASPSVGYAAEELQRFYEQASGRKLPIARGTKEGSARHIFVGPGEAMRRSPVGFDVEGAELGEEGFRIVLRDARIAIAGGEPRGTLYGVYTFLEDFLGVRFLTADHTWVPPVGAWRRVEPIDRVFRPLFAFRWSYYGEINRRPEFAARMRVNTIPRDARLGGHTPLQNISHSFYRQIPTSKYGKEHPEYFALRGGKRLARVDNDARDTEPCLANPEARRVIREAVLEELAHRPDAKNVSVSQNDNAKFCQGPECAALDEREGTPMGSILRLVNEVADAVAEKYPGVDVGTLAYWYSRKPPKTLRPRPNVQIQLCSIECCQIHPIDDPACPRNVAFCEDLRAWGKISKNISIWNYNTDFTNYLLPCPNLRSIERNVRFFAAHHVRGVFMQAPGNAWGAELSELRNYVICRLIWDPSRSAEALIGEFARLHYRSAAPPILRYLDLVHDAARSSGKHQNCFASSGEAYGLGQELVPEALALFEKALELADDDAVRRRVEQASIAAYRLALDPVWSATGPAAVDAELLKAKRPLIHRFLELCEKYGIDRASEHQPFSADRARLEKLLATR